MCEHAAATAGAVMTALEPTLNNLLTVEGLINTPNGKAAIAAYDAAAVAVTNWKSGTAAQNVLELVNAFQAVFQTLPLPVTVEALGNVILAGIATVIGIIEANSPAPAEPAASPATPEVTAAAQTFHAHAVAASTETKVTALTGIKVSRWDKARVAVGDTHVAAQRYTETWNKAVDDNKLPAELKVAA